MKDMARVMEGFADHVDPTFEAHLVLAGPAVTGVADAPEPAQIYDDCAERWRGLPHALRGRVHLACVPMTDPDERRDVLR
jgi:trehalose synthase